jgi:hypothetical protein
MGDCPRLRWRRPILTFPRGRVKEQFGEQLNKPYQLCKTSRC